jgi:hypothetical protein
LARKQSLILGNGERQLSLAELSRVIPIERCQKTIYRWCTVGRHGVVLESINGTNGLLSSLEAYHRFMRRLQG